MERPYVDVGKWARALKNICLVILIAILLTYFLLKMPPSRDKISKTENNGTYRIDGAYFRSFGESIFIKKDLKKVSLPRLICEAIYLDIVFNQTSPFMSQYGIIRDDLTVKINGLSIDFAEPKALETLGELVGVTV